jgi:E3 ubiquitin-protein ligase HUWE1
MDMGFSRESCVEALLCSATLEQATEYLLVNPRPSVRRSLMQELEEDDAVLRAIAMSLDSGGGAADKAKDGVVGDKGKEKEEEKSEEAREEDEEKEYLGLTPEIESLACDGEDPGVYMDEFAGDGLQWCLSLLDQVPGAVFHVSQVMHTAMSRNGDAWRDAVVKSLVENVCEVARTLVALCSSVSAVEKREEAVKGPVASKAAVRIHLFMLLFDKMKV